MPDSSREEIAKLEALYANNPAGRVFTHLAEAYRKAGEYERARGILEEGLQKHPGYASAYVVMGRVLMDLNDKDQAASSFRQVLDLDPHNLVALQSLGELARSDGRTDEAIRYFEDLRQHDPGNDDVAQIIDDLRNPQPAAPETASEPAEVEAETTSPTEEWRPEPTSYEPEPASYEPETVYEPEPSTWVEPQAEAPWNPEAGTGDFTESETQNEPEPEPWQADTTSAPETDTPDVVSPFEETTHDFNLGWVQPEPEQTSAPDELGDLNSISQAADTFEVVGETFAPEEIDLGVLEPAVDQSAPETEGDGEVLTETIAELYRRQGLYDRAADVYRALLQARPEDADLQAKLAEVESMSQPHQTDEIPEEPWGYRDPWETPEVDTEQAAAWLAGGAPPTESPPTPYAWTEQPAEMATDTGRPIGAYFRDLLAWQPRAGSSPAMEAAAGSETIVSDAATSAEAFDEWFGGGAPPAPDQLSAEAAPAGSPETSSQEGSDDDDDLEMFRSWLQSLKK